MPVNFSKGDLKRMEERNIKWEDIDETMRISRIEDHEGEERTTLARDTEHGLRVSYDQKGRS
jgi:hypothetical protein